MGFTFTHNGEEMAMRLRAIRGRVEAPEEALHEIGEHMTNTSIPKNFQAEGRPNPWPRGPWSAERQMNRRGASGLVGSIRHEVQRGRLRVGTNKRYARQRQFGGEIRPKLARALAVPLPGVPAHMGRPRRWGGRLFMMPSVKGDPNTVGVLAIAGPGGDPVPKFVLRGRVRQPPRPFLVWQDEDIAYVQRTLGRYALEGH